MSVSLLPSDRPGQAIASTISTAEKNCTLVHLYYIFLVHHRVRNRVVRKGALICRPRQIDRWVSDDSLIDCLTSEHLDRSLSKLADLGG